MVSAGALVSGQRARAGRPAERPRVSAGAWVYQQLQYAKAQTRIATATDVWLDIIARDFFGDRLFRRVGPRRRGIWEQSDPARTVPGTRDTRCHRRGACRISRGARRDCVRAGPVERYGRVRFVQRRPRRLASGYGSAGGWGSLALPFQCFITAYRPVGSGIAAVSRLGRTPAGGYGGEARSNTPAWKWCGAR